MVQLIVNKYIHKCVLDGDDMMMNTLFGDEIVNSTELRNNQKQWFEVAVYKPVTVNYGRRQLAIVNREQLGKMYAANYYLELVLKVYEEFNEGESKTLVWANYLTEQDKLSFHKDLLTTALTSIVTNNWSALERLLEDWKATAEIESNPELAAALTEKGNPKEYVHLEEKV